MPSTSREVAEELQTGTTRSESYVSISSATSISTSSSASLEAENYFLKQEVHQLKKQLEQLNIRFSYNVVRNKDNLVNMYTGLPDTNMFSCLFNYLDKLEINYYSGWRVESIPKEDQLLICLMKLRLNLLHADLAERFNCSISTITNIVLTWLHVLHEALYKRILLKHVPLTEKNKTCLPSAFTPFTNCKITLDCTEIYTAVPQQMSKQKQTYSSYKHRNTLKGLVGVAPNGVIIFCSDLYVGNTSDKKITQHCGVLNLLKEGDLVLADKGFLIGDILPPGVLLNTPPFLLQSQFTVEEAQLTETIAKARIHVERAIRRVKIFKILQCIPETMRMHSSLIFQVCACLTLFRYPLIKEVEELFSSEQT